ncbi:MAG TPA: high-affinity nickel-transport family protein [Polyangiaceae bacterium]
MNALAVLALGFFLGMRHATDADHVVAVSAIVSRERSPRAALWIGALWGLGHSATILFVGGAIVLFGLVIPPRLGLSLEMSVAVMLVVLGALNLSGGLRGIQAAAHDDSSTHSAGGHTHRPLAAGAWRLRPLCVGLVHGLAGSAAVALLVLATITDARWALGYLAIFGFGTVLGMMLLTSALSVPLAAAARRFASFDRGIARATGFLSVAFGLFLAYRIGIHDGLFTSSANFTPR